MHIKRKNDKQGNLLKVSSLFSEIFTKIGVRPHELREFLAVVTSNIDAFYKPKRYFPDICASSVDIQQSILWNVSYLKQVKQLNKMKQKVLILIIINSYVGFYGAFKEFSVRLQQ